MKHFPKSIHKVQCARTLHFLTMHFGIRRKNRGNILDQSYSTFQRHRQRCWDFYSFGLDIMSVLLNSLSLPSSFDGFKTQSWINLIMSYCILGYSGMSCFSVLILLRERYKGFPCWKMMSKCCQFPISGSTVLPAIANRYVGMTLKMTIYRYTHCCLGHLPHRRGLWALQLASNCESRVHAELTNIQCHGTMLPL